MLDALEQRVKQFRRREELWPLRVPPDPLLLDSIIDQALRGEHRRFDPLTLRSRTLLHLEWEDGSSWSAWVAALPSGIKLYCDTGHDETRVLASGGRNEGDSSDRTFLERLSESGGRHFGIEMSGGAPSRVRSSITDRAFLVEAFVNLFEVTGTEASVRAQLAEEEVTAPPETSRGTDFTAAVEQWLDRALRASRGSPDRTAESPC